MAGPTEYQHSGEFSPLSLVLRLELTSNSASEIENVCSDIVTNMRRIGAPYGGPIPLPKQRVYSDDGTHSDLHMRIIDLDTNEGTAKWFKSFICPETVKVKCSIKEKRR